MRGPKETIEKLELELAILKDQLKTLERTNARLVNPEGVPDDRAAFYVTLLEAANDAIILIDDYRFIDCNGKALEMFGCTKEQLINKKPSEFSPEYQLDSSNSEEGALERIDTAFNTGTILFEWQHTKLNGTLFDVEVNLNRVRYGSEDYLLAILRDITERKKIERALRNSLDEISSLNDISRRVNSTLSLEQVLQESTRRIYKILLPDLIMIFMKEDHNLVLRNSYVHNEKYRHENTPVHKVGECLCGLAVSEDRTIYSYDIDRDERCTLDECKRTGLKSFAAIPIKRDADVIGVLGIASSTPRDFKERSIFLETIANHISIGIQNALLHENLRKYTVELEQVIAQQKHSEDLLMQSEERFRSLVENTSDTIWEIDSEGVYVYVSPRVRDLLGYEPVEIIGKTPFEFMPSTDSEKVKVDFNQFKTAKKPFMNYKSIFIHKSGYPVVLESSGEPILNDDNDVTGYRGIDRDVTERVQAEKRFRLAARAVSDVIYEWNVKTNSLTWYGGLENILGYEIDEIPDTIDKWRKLMHPADREALERATGNSVRVTAAIEHEYRILHKNGSWRMLATYGLPQIESDGKIVKWIGACRDITEKNQSQLRLKLALEGSKSGVWEWNIITGDVVLDMRIEEIFGLEPGTFDGRYETYRDAIHPADTDWVQKHIQEAIESPGWGNTYLIEHRILLPNSETRWVLLNGAITRSQDGIAVRMVGVCRDITERKNAERALRKSEAKYIDLYENAPDMYVTVNARTSLIEGCNSTLANTLGHTKAEIIGRPVFDFYHPDCLGEVEKAFNEFTENGTIIDKELKLLKKDGSVLDVSLNVSSVRDEDDTILFSRSTLRDITERKRNSAVNSSRLHLLQFAEMHTLPELLEETLNEAEKLTDSRVGFYHFVEEDQVTLSLQDWSTRTKTEFCTAEGKGLHYDISEAGVWVDCVRELKPVIHNDYASLPHRKGMPEGHAEVIRELVVPVIRGDKIKAILGIGNKPVNYIKQDVEAVSLLANLAWEIAERKIVNEALRTNEAKLREAQQMANLGYWYWDVKSGDVQWSEEVFKIFQLNPDEFTPQIDSILSLSPWPEENKRDQELIQKAIESKNQGSYEQRFLRPDGSIGYYSSTFQGVYDNSGALVSIRGTVQDITQRKAAEQQLLENEENLRITLDSIGDAVISTDINGLIIRMNPVAESLTGWDINEAVGNPLNEVFNICNGKTGEPCQNPVEKVMESGKIIGLANDTILVAKDGSEYQIADSGAPIKDSFDNIVGVVMVFRDVTEKYEQEKRIRKSQEQLSRLMYDLPGAVYQCLNDRNWTMIFYSEGIKDLTGIPPQDFIEGRVQLNDLILPEHRGQVWDNVQKAIQKKESFELVYQIMTIDDEIKWIWEKGQGIFDENGELEMLEGIQIDISDVKLAEKSLDASERLIKEITDNLPSLITFIDKNGRYQFCNASYSKWFNKTKEEILGKTVEEIIGEFIPDSMREQQQKALSGQTVHFYDMVNLPSGEIKHVSVDYIPAKNEKGELEGFYSLVNDLTGLHEAEEAVRESEERYRLAQQVSGIGTWEWNIEENTIFWSDEVLETWGLKSEGFKGTLEEVAGSIHPDDLEYWQENVRASVEDGKEHNIEMRVIWPDKSIHWVAVYGDAERDKNGKAKRLIGVVMDITERKLAEQELRQSRQALDNAQKLAHLGSWEIDVITGEIIGTDELYLIYGFEPGDPAFDKDTLRDHVHPNDIAYMDEIREKLVKGETVDFEHRIVMPDGEIRYVWGRGMPRLDSSGKPMTLIGTIMDITERKLAELALIENREMLAQSQKIAHVGSFYRDLSTGILKWSDEAYKILGYEPGEIEPDMKFFMSAIHPDDREKFLEIDRNVQKENTHFKREYRIIRKDGEVRYLNAEVYPASNEAGEVVAQYGVVQDITERKQAEIDLLTSYQTSADMIRKIQIGFFIYEYQAPDKLILRSANPEAIRLTGIDIEKMAGKEFDEVWINAREEGLTDIYMDAARTGKMLEIEDGYYRDDRIAGYYRVRAFRIPGDKLAVSFEDITKVKTAERRIKAERDKAQQYLDIAETVLVAISSDGIINLINKKGCSLLGYTEEELMGTNWFDTVIPEEQIEQVKSVFEDIMEGRIEAYAYFENHVKTKDNDQRLVAWHNTYLKDQNGKITGTLSSGEDITERRKAEDALKAEKDFVSRLNETSPIGIVTMNTGGEIIFANEMAEYILGLERDKVMKLKYNSPEWRITDCEGNPFPEEDLPFNKVLRTKETVFDIEHCIQHGDGKLMYLSINATPLLNDNGEVESIIAIISDVTDRKKAEKQTRESEERFRLVAETIRDVFWLESVDTKDIIYISPEYDNIWGRPRLNLEKSPNEWIEAIHPDDRERTLIFVSAQMEEGNSYSHEYRVVQPDGNVRWIHERGFPIKDDGGKVTMYAGICSDLTRRKKAEEEIQRSKARIESIFRAAPIGIGLVSNRQILSANEFLCEMTGYANEEMVGKNTEFLYPSHYEYEWVGEKQEKQLDKKGIGTVETKWRCKNGDIIDILLCVAPVDTRDLLGGVTFAALDITQRKRDEEELKNAYAEIEALKNRLEQENIYLQKEIELEHNFHEIIGSSKSLQKALHKVEQVAGTDSTVFILGETGTGKELFARAIHNLSNRRNRPLVKVNCAALPATLIESELFGYEKGAFTGAVSRREGRFDLANGGTIFLDEIGDIPVDLQVKLLRVLQESEFERLGGTKTVKVDVRVIAATNRDLDKAVEDGKFRLDLYHRLNVFPIFVPPLRERHDDIPILVKHFNEKYCQKIGKKIDKIPKNIMTRLQEYDWPGNVRGLENVIERAVIISKGNQLDLGEWETKAFVKVSPSHISSLEELEREHILKTLKITNWKVSGKDGAAQILKIKPTTLEARMKKLGIKRPS